MAVDSTRWRFLEDEYNEEQWTVLFLTVMTFDIIIIISVPLYHPTSNPSSSLWVILGCVMHKTPICYCPHSIFKLKCSILIKSIYYYHHNDQSSVVCTHSGIESILDNRRDHFWMLLNSFGQSFSRTHVVDHLEQRQFSPGHSSPTLWNILCAPPTILEWRQCRTVV